MNTQYSYPHKELWGDRIWESRMSPLIPLARWIERTNIRLNRIPAKPATERRSEGRYDSKANALTWPEVVDFWQKKGLHYHCTSMTLPWIAMIPSNHMGMQGYDDPMDTILVLVNADLSDPSWGMYTLGKYGASLERAAAERHTLLFIASDSADGTHQYISILQEAIILFHLNYQRLFLDASAVREAGISLKDIPGFMYPDSAMRRIGGMEVLEMSGRWTNRDSLIHKLITQDSSSNAAFDRQALIHSATGRSMAEAISYEYEYDDAEDPCLLRHWEEKGLACEFHDRNGEQWISFLPRSASDEPGRKLPCMCILQEVNRFDPHQAITGFSYYYQYLDIAAQGECMLLFFALESLDDNDLLHEILDDAEKIYPLDRSRVYITGHSHNGRFAAEYMRRHQDDIAALATLGNEPGQLSARVTSGFFVAPSAMKARMPTSDWSMTKSGGMTPAARSSATRT